MQRQLRISGSPAALAAAIRSADPTTSRALIRRHQGQVGNATVSRLLAAEERGPGQAALPVQRWAVTVPPGTADCNVVVSWMNRHSPYSGRSGWALTSPTFGWGGDYSYSGSGDSVTVSMLHPDRQPEHDRRHAELGADRFRDEAGLDRTTLPSAPRATHFSSGAEHGPRILRRPRMRAGPRPRRRRPLRSPASRGRPVSTSRRRGLPQEPGR